MEFVPHYSFHLYLQVLSLSAQHFYCSSAAVILYFPLTHDLFDTWIKKHKSGMYSEGILFLLLCSCQKYSCCLLKAFEESGQQQSIHFIYPFLQSPPPSPFLVSTEEHFSLLLLFAGRPEALTSLARKKKDFLTNVPGDVTF